MGFIYLFLLLLSITLTIYHTNKYAYELDRYDVKWISFLLIFPTYCIASIFIGYLIEIMFF